MVQEAQAGWVGASAMLVSANAPQIKVPHD